MSSLIFILQMKKYNIKDLELYSGVKAHTIRMWEKRYNLLHPMRTETNIRVYDEESLKKLINVATLRKSGYKISELAKYSDEKILEQVLLLSNGSEKYQQTINNMICAMIELDDAKFKKIMSDSFLNIGFEETFLKIIHPFIKQLELLWQTNNIKLIHRYFVCNILRQRLIVAIDGVMVSNKSNANRFILYLPQNELKELKLLFYSYILKKYGHKVIYLGQNVHISELIEILKTKTPDYSLTYFSDIKNKDVIKDYLTTIAHQFNQQQFLFSGIDAFKDGEKPSNVEYVSSPQYFIDWMKNMKN